jgi:hypothetical protein
MTTFNEYYNTLANNRNITRADVMIHCIFKAIRSKTADKLALAQILVDRAFTPPTATNKVANGALSYWGFHHAKYEARYKVGFGTTIKFPFEYSEEEALMFLSILKEIKAPK